MAVLLAVIVCASPLPIEATGPRLAIKPPQAEIKVNNKRIQRLQEGIIEQKLNILNSRKKERDVLNELAEINNRLLKQRQRLARIKHEYIIREQQLDADQKKLVRITVEHEAFKPHVEKRLAAYYQTGTVSMVNVLFSSRSLPDMLDLRESFRRLLQHDRNAIRNYRATVAELEQTRRVHTREREKLIAIMEQVRREEQSLADTQAARQRLLKRIGTEKALYQQAAAEIKKAATELADTLRELRMRATPVLAAAAPAPVRPLAARPEATANDRSFAGHKGRLAPPVAGILLPRSRRNSSGKLVETPGIDIQIPAGTPVKAIYAGRVITSARLKNYGNLLIIDHGHQYYSVISRAARFYKKEGQLVKKGEIIGQTGPDTARPGHGLHFELRHGVNPVDPLEWLNTSTLTGRSSR
ncbi:MAG: peptidoglycan DD-metalloendopeptidase family protein [Desulfobacterales bacterium]|nr:peptidoglycan DD-metalloendopeptidase family protein [Desulfobacterales bacterium]